jgi:VWFA-related protein
MLTSQQIRTLNPERIRLTVSLPRIKAAGLNPSSKIDVEHRRLLTIALLFLSITFTFQEVLAQSQPDERPKIKNFGSSLDRLNWDPDLQQAVEKKAPARKANGSDDEDVIKVETSLVICSVTVLDQQGKVVTNLTKDDFIITENAQPQQVYHFSLGNDLSVPRTIVLLIDYSGSQSPFIKQSVAAARVLVDKLGPKDTMAIVTDDVKLLVDFTRDKAVLKHALDSLYQKSKKKQYGQSKQFSALMAAIREMFRAEDIRPIVIFQTDGDQVFGLQPSTPTLFGMPAPPPDAGLLERFSLRDLYHAIEQSRASVYTVIPGMRHIEAVNSRDLTVEPSIMPARTPIMTGAGDLIKWQQMAAAGAAIGGWTAYLQNPEDAANIYGRILDDINSRYVLGYYPSDKTRDGKRRRVQVDVRGHPEYSVTGRKSYFAGAPDQ